MSAQDTSANVGKVSRERRLEEAVVEALRHSSALLSDHLGVYTTDDFDRYCHLIAMVKGLSSVLEA